jgi:hypothetical protein
LPYGIGLRRPSSGEKTDRSERGECKYERQAFHSLSPQEH